MADAILELERRRAESNQRADAHRAERDRLNAEARTLADKRGALLDELHAQSAEAQEHRRQRDEFNAQVREAKRLREESNRRFQELGDQLADAKRSHAPKPGAVPSWRLRKELRELEFRHMTSALTAEQEKRLVGEMQRLELALRDQEDQFRKDPAIEKLIQDYNTAREDAERHHHGVGELADSAQRAHEAMAAAFMRVDDLRRQTDETQGKLVEVKGAADEAHRAHISTIEEVRDIEKLLHAAHGGRVGADQGFAEPPREEDFLARLKKGEKVSTADLLELQKGARG